MCSMSRFLASVLDRRAEPGLLGEQRPDGVAQLVPAAVGDGDVHHHPVDLGRSRRRPCAGGRRSRSGSRSSAPTGWTCQRPVPASSSTRPSITSSSGPISSALGPAVVVGRQHPEGDDRDADLVAPLHEVAQPPRARPGSPRSAACRARSSGPSAGCRRRAPPRAGAADRGRARRSAGARRSRRAAPRGGGGRGTPATGLQRARLAAYSRVWLTWLGSQQPRTRRPSMPTRPRRGPATTSSARSSPGCGAGCTPAWRPLALAAGIVLVVLAPTERGRRRRGRLPGGVGAALRHQRALPPLLLGPARRGRPAPARPREHLRLHRRDLHPARAAAPATAARGWRCW